MEKHNLLKIEVFFSEKENGIGATYKATPMMKSLIEDTNANDMLQEALQEVNEILEGLFDKIDNRLKEVEGEENV